MFSCEFCEISKNIFFTEHPRTTASMSNFEGNQIFKNHYTEENKLSETSFNIKRNVSLIENLDNFVCYTSVACDWQGIISRSTPPKAAELSLVVHRMPGSKDSVKLFHRKGISISCTDVLKQIKHFSFDTQNSSNVIPKNIPKGQPTHMTIDISDGR